MEEKKEPGTWRLRKQLVLEEVDRLSERAFAGNWNGIETALIAAGLVAVSNQVKMCRDCKKV